MNTIIEIREMGKLVKKYKSEGLSIGFIPTMGYLHEGHLSLVKKAREENDIVICSIFVNPLQFGPNEDLDRYPRDKERDEKVLSNADVDHLFHPSVEEMYPTKPSIHVHVKDRTDVLCGEKRSGHFDGVATVLMKLFHIISPDRVYMGLKDAQQVAVVDLIIQEFNFPIQLVPGETVREEDGLAKSSRNIYLSLDERKDAPLIYKSLQKAKEAVLNGETSVDKIRHIISGELSKLKNGEVDYIEVLTYPTLKTMETIKGKVIMAIAYKFQSARLIDNIIIEN